MQTFPNPSLEWTCTGLALGPRGSHCHHPHRGPSAIPASAPSSNDRQHMTEAIAELQTVKFWIITAGLGIVFSVIANFLTDALKRSWNWPRRALPNSLHLAHHSRPKADHSSEPAIASALLFLVGIGLLFWFFPPAGDWVSFHRLVLSSGPAAITILLFDPRYITGISILGYAAEAFGMRKPTEFSTWIWVGFHLGIATLIALLVALIVTFLPQVLNVA